MKHVLLTGRPGVGKTTLICEVAQHLKQYDPVGFFTQEIQENGHRKGFRLVSINGRSGMLSHVQHKGPYRVGRYGVDLTGFEKFLSELDLCHSPSPLVIIDEIGKMECLSTQFRKEIEALLDSSKLVFATIALRGEGFIKEVKQRQNCRLLGVTVENRNHLIDTVMTELLEQLGPQRGTD